MGCKGRASKLPFNGNSQEKSVKPLESKVYFVGAGPGDPDLITVKGRKLLDQADVVIYAGSLVNFALLDGIRAETFNSSKMNLDEIMETAIKSIKDGKLVVRLHTGDTSLYSAISEQIERLRELDIKYEVIPGVSSAMAGAAVLGQELTIPEISQTVIMTRTAGRTPVPENEKLSEMAKHRTTMVLFLSVGLIEKVAEELKNGYQEDTPVAIIYKATWPEQKIIRGTLGNIVELVKESGINKTALIYVGEVLKASEGYTGKRSKLYHEDFKHGYRS
jgi:precorrin-4/cobalt-precorrin-4 C11-methyltransferase